MPQMAPIMWLTLFFFTISSFILLMTFIYFYKTNNTYFFNKFLNKKTSWLWPK